jgi:hypothetical protein
MNAFYCPIFSCGIEKQDSSIIAKNKRWEKYCGEGGMTHGYL